MTTDEISGQATIPVAELEGLVESWQQWTMDDVKTNHDLGYKDGLESAADDLEALIEEYQYE